MDEIERVFKHEIEEKYEKQYMQNFSTFLNNFPDPNVLDNGRCMSRVPMMDGGIDFVTSTHRPDCDHFRFDLSRRIMGITHEHTGPGFIQEAAEILASAGIDARVINIHTIKPLDKDIIIKAAKETGAILVAEEHSIIGGLGSAVCEAVCEECPVPVVRFGMNDEFGRSGSAAKLLEMYGFTAENFAQLAQKAISLKK